ncbi:hypothetical protein CEXT_637411 [Caerostris extrusa]|uniref:Secreted protein n=1 Tax=Caerostris extrusa TaxID=172846 RepID=A0AAV4N2B1_CAEEX|nr:hypothetical protein CEXT_637411 [Caerostris extrusa]
MTLSTHCGIYSNASLILVRFKTPCCHSNGLVMRRRNFLLLFFLLSLQHEGLCSRDIAQNIRRCSKMLGDRSYVVPVCIVFSTPPPFRLSSSYKSIHR